ncbi:MAG TPA: PilC/PilY family type IV pilus protein [Syntrophales bacterium]|nr:PilC/PilY family type IV pilus protein [Syntrophales bacterium]HOL59857.1 PilC/PilY family type IV pilus protein [Syntrophales bacterium]HPO36004.1 PilC/PilY family type IV pilus protein [Syntrophales bacterium]
MRKKIVLLALIFACLCHSGYSLATQPEAGEEALFTNTNSPDALILLDLTGSMNWNPAGGALCVPSSASCGGSGVGHIATNADGSCPSGYKACTGSFTYPLYGDSACAGPFYTSSGTGHTTNCSRLNIAKRALFNLLDDNGDGVINSADEGSLNVRLGYMRFYNCSSDDTEGSYTSGCIQIPGSSSSRRYIGSKYSQIFCGSKDSCSSPSYYASPCYAIGCESASGGTPLASALAEAKIYLDAHKAADPAKNCRHKFVILVTDGADTFACSGSGAECQNLMYKRRREVVARAKALADAGYRVFVIGFGAAMPNYLENTLNWMAYYGGTDNPNQANSGDPSAFTPGTPGACTNLTSESATCYDDSGAHSTENFKATSGDPGYLPLSGYAFIAANASELAEALKAAMTIIRQANYSFSQASVQSSRTADENNLYEGSFEPVESDPFWRGHLKKYQINSDGTVGAVLWDAGEILAATNAANRRIWTYKAGSLVDFTTANITPADLGITTGTETEKEAARNGVVGYIRGESAFNPETGGWKLGDVFRSTPITVGTPSAYFEDTRDCQNRFTEHRANHVRTSANGYRLIVAGANDGQFHAFRTGNGSEAWSFVPPNLLTKLKLMTHQSHPTSLIHQYFVDGPVTVADYWTGQDDGTCGSACAFHGNCKAADSWRTILTFALGRGATGYAWSSSPSCDSGIAATYSSGTPYFCGYYAFNMNDSLNPSFLWVGPTFSDASTAASLGPYLGDPWSKMMVGRVKVWDGGEEKEKWVGFIGAGYNAGDCAGGGGCDTRGKGFFVIDLNDGKILWSYTRLNNSNMNYSLPATPAIVDTDNDGFIDTVYIGDLGGNMWRFKLCRSADIYNKCTYTNWSGGMLFDSSTGNIRPIYTSAAVARDTSGNLWVYWGTGDKTDPTAPNAQEHFYGIKDLDRTSTYRLSDIDNITSPTQTYNPNSTDKVGYRLQLTGQGEKILSDPTVFGGVVYFTTFTPASGNDPCEQAGTASLYGINYVTGGAALTTASGTARSMVIGTGIPSAPVVSLKPGGGSTPDIYVTTSGGTGISASTQRVNITPPGAANKTNMLYWRDRRIR